jgi:ABC-type branched-subunit amino acid transport system substrate-binding protein
LGDAIAEYGAERVGVQTMYFDEGVVLVSQTGDYPNTREVIWMGTESSGRSQRMLDDGAGLQAALGGFSSLMTPAKSWKWERMDEEYFDLVAQPASFYTAADYDAAWCLALSVLEVGSVKADDVVEAWPDVPRNFWGASGWVDLDENGDRKPGIFDIWGFTGDGEDFTSYGQYNGIEIVVNWDDAVLAENGFTRPGPP